ncbi:MAG: PAS domain S-box protein [Saprospiraceae bacterium]|nr:PAS domain S-box protein [Saprospiraceae bacterium]
MTIANKNIDSLLMEVDSLRKELKSHKEKLQNSEDEYFELVEKTNLHLRELFNNSNDLVQISKPSGEFKFVNKTWRDKLLYTQQEIKKLKLVDVIHPDYRKKTLERLMEITAGSNEERFDTVLISKLGKNIYVNGRISCVFDGEQPVEYRSIFYDISDRIRAESAQSLYYKIANLTTHQHNIDRLYKEVYHEISRHLKVRNFTVSLKDYHDKLTFPYRINEYNERHQNKRTEILLTEYTIERGRPLIIYREGIEKIANEKKIRLRGELPRIWLGVPIQTNDKPNGVISIYSYRDEIVFNNKDLELLDFISSQVSQAIIRISNEEKIVDQAARLSAIFESSTHQIWSVDRKYRFTSFNQNYAESFKHYYGVEPEIGESLSGKYRKLSSKDDRQFWTEKYDLAFNGENQNFQTFIVDHQENEIWRDIFLNPISLPDGTIQEVSVIANDVTEKKYAENQLKVSEEKFRTIFESFQDIYFRCNLNGIITMISPSATLMLGHDTDELIGSDILAYFESRRKTSTMLKKLFDKKLVKNFEGTVRTKRGRKIQFLCNIRLITQKGQDVEIEGVVRDITALKKSNQELRKAKDLAEKSLRIKERFLANMSHEIRTPMNGIIGMIDLIGSTKLNLEQSEYIQTIKKSSDTLLNILNDILDLSKIEAGKMELRSEPVKLIETFEKVYELYSQQAQINNIFLYYHLDDRLPEMVVTDETRLLQVISNLVSNAIKFSEKKGNVNISIRLGEEKSDHYVFKVSIKDSGIGISEKDQQLLFQSFNQIDSSVSKKFGGTGLGLAISKELVKSMAGNIGVVSTPGLGSTFWFTFKAAKLSDDLKLKQEDETALSKQFEGTAPKILLVDDNDINRRVASQILKKSGCKVIEARDGFEAVSKVKRSTFDLIFMDIQMPRMDGIETTKKIRTLRLKKSSPVVAMTAYSMEEDRKKFLEQGMDDYISKPIKAHALIDKVKSWIKFEPKEVPIKQFEEVHDLVINQNTLNQLNKYGGKELIESVLQDFNDEASQQVQNALAHYSKEDFESILKEMHTLKGNAGTLGIERLSKQAANIEMKIKEHNFDKLKPELAKLEDSLEEFKEIYKNLSKQPEAP